MSQIIVSAFLLLLLGTNLCVVDPNLQEEFVMTEQNLCMVVRVYKDLWPFQVTPLLGVALSLSLCISISRA